MGVVTEIVMGTGRGTSMIGRGMVTEDVATVDGSHDRDHDRRRSRYIIIIRGEGLVVNKKLLSILSHLPSSIHILDLIILLSNLPGITKSLCPLVNLLYGIYIGTISTLQWAPIGILP